MKEWQGLELSDGTLLRYYDQNGMRIGELHTDETYNKRFVDIDRKYKMTNWVISQWDYYEVITPEEAMLFRLENA